MARCIGRPPRLRALNGIAHSPTHMHLLPTSASGISIEFSYHNLNSRRDGQFGRAGGTKALVVSSSSPAGHQENPDDLAVRWLVIGGFSDFWVQLDLEGRFCDPALPTSHSTEEAVVVDPVSSTRHSFLSSVHCFGW